VIISEVAQNVVMIGESVMTVNKIGPFMLI